MWPVFSLQWRNQGALGLLIAKQYEDSLTLSSILNHAPAPNEETWVRPNLTCNKLFVYF